MRLRFYYIPFMRLRTYAVAVSAILVAIALISMGTRGLNFGIDFTGGALVQLEFQQPPVIEEIRSHLSAVGLGDSTIQHFGSDREILVRAPIISDESAAAMELISLIRETLSAQYGDQMDVLRIETVGPRVGGELREQGTYAILYALLAIVAYIWWRYELNFGVAAVIALVHDVVITLGIFSLAGVTFSLPVLAAILTVIGYSLNDTIVVFDRIRENLYIPEGKEKPSIISIINTSITETLSRTILTSGTTLIVVAVLYFFGGEVINGFAFTLLVGIIVGTYSSIFVASLLLVYWRPRYIEPHLKKLQEKPEEVV
ncbi:protein translocase subunit SecF [Desulfurispirillum indicum]|uniref:Protein translocase subunit SecF n=1 Tax=Desulfurispirillum indicum (strain ATCC BAA-1389 / DSM 22839 / S5) TaxID=653733 RepID=SECF_DESIS|nr:protein translocase subunit SecF [Desulfurispirillum indicum]E6W4K9.1 RecName: Full=Protein translocase subunit SecF [Desulfurispirillum indicum S5]ADU67082.1 protein-export membrane protein SecF [Desulfurispirillum indicum S5]UCZ56401.1 protein translocase subunit SecF [Desulfurispirillum indicum]